MVRAFAVSSVLFIVACGQVITLGGECTTRDQCASGESCVTAPAGFCSKSCAVEGSFKDCPGGTVCTYFGASIQVCSKYCTASSACRINYQCADVKGTESVGKKSCQPDNVVR